MRTALTPLVERYLSCHKACDKAHGNSDFVSDWESQMMTLTLSQFHVLRNSIDAFKPMVAVLRHDGECGLR